MCSHARKIGDVTGVRAVSESDFRGRAEMVRITTYLRGRGVFHMPRSEDTVKRQPLYKQRQRVAW